MTQSVILFAYFTRFLAFNISKTNANIYERLKGFLFSHGILCDAPKKSRGKNLIITIF